MSNRCTTDDLTVFVIVLSTFIWIGNAATATSTVADAQNAQRNVFASDIYNAIATSKLSENVVISPAAIQTSMALAYYGAKDKTATELMTGIRLGSSNADQVVQQFGDFQQTFTRDNHVRLFNNIYINQNLEFKAKFKEVAQRHFQSNIEKVDFHPPYNKRTADRINRLVEEKTGGKIVNILLPQRMSDLIDGIIVNGIAFTGAPWQKAFKPDRTEKKTFSTGSQSFEVDTMWTLNNFNYGENSNLDSKIIELPYQNIDYSMVILLPNKKNGLADLVRRIAGKDIVELIDSSISTEKVEVTLPRFSVSFDVSLEQPFKQLGVTTMFSRQGDFGNMYRMFVSHFINSADHKAYVDVSEDGAEQPLQPSGGIKGLFSRPKKFEVDHPFVFLIKHKKSVIFFGHISNYAFV